MNTARSSDKDHNAKPIKSKAKAQTKASPPPSPPLDLKPDPIDSAAHAGLRYVGEGEAGIRRLKAGRGFAYRDAEGHPVRDQSTLERLRALAMPPAYCDVWFCADAKGHLQATGIDERGRKQYRYHARWREVRDEAKYTRMLAFGRALPLLRRRIDEDLKRSGMPREKVLGTIVQLLEKTAIRIGNEQYVRENKSYGLTTMRNRHAKIEAGTVRFQFKGKSGKYHRIELHDRRLARLLTKLQELPGQELFQYVDSEGQTHSIASHDVNDYLHEITGQPFTAKDFRTWTGTLLAALALNEFEAFDSDVQAKKNILRAIESVAERLGNTPSICRKCYVHPAIFETYLDGSMIETLRQLTQEEMDQSLRDLQPEEAAVMVLLQHRLAAEAAS